MGGMEAANSILTKTSLSRLSRIWMEVRQALRATWAGERLAVEDIARWLRQG